MHEVTKVQPPKLQSLVGCLFALTQKEVKAKYAKSSLGIGWSFLQPAMVFGVYYSVFSVLVRWEVPSLYGAPSYISFFLLGFIPYFLFSETVNRSADILLDNQNIIKTMKLTPELFVGAAFMSALMFGFVFSLIAVATLYITGASLNTSAIYLFFFIACLTFLCLGAGLIVAGITVVFYDFRHVVSTLTHILFFASPVFYSFETVTLLNESHPVLGTMILTNPLFSIIKGVRMAVFASDGLSQEISLLVLSFSSAALFLLIGLKLFRSIRAELADYL